MQKMTMIGRLGSEIEIRKTKNGDSVCEFNLVDSKKINGVDIATWVKWRAWKHTADVLSRYVRKGDMVYVEGEMSNESYEVDGQKRHKDIFTVLRFQLLPNYRRDEKKDEHEVEEYNNFEEKKSDFDSQFVEDDLPFI